MLVIRAHAACWVQAERRAADAETASKIDDFIEVQCVCVCVCVAGLCACNLCCSCQLAACGLVEVCLWAARRKLALLFTNGLRMLNALRHHPPACIGPLTPATHRRPCLTQELEGYAEGQHAFSFVIEDHAGNSFISGADGGTASEHLAWLVASSQSCCVHLLAFQHGNMGKLPCHC